MITTPIAHADDGNPVDNLNDAIAWLEAESHRMIRDCRRTMADGTAAFPPQVGIHYEAFWLRDYAYMLEGCRNRFSEKELRDACLLFVSAQRDDGACVDCVGFDGTPIYKPGMGTMGANPVADGSPFTVAVAWHTWKRLGDRELLAKVLDPLVKAMGAVPRNPKTGLVHIDPNVPWDRCPYGFTDTVRKQGDVLFSSLLFVEAGHRLAEMLEAADRPDEAKHWQAAANRAAEAIRRVFWDADVGLFRAATVQCREPDIWGSAFAVYLRVASPQQARTIARYFRDHYNEIVQHGQIRHLPGGVYWEKAGPRDRYQNGAYWATPTGWFISTLDRVDPALADRTVIDMVNDFRRRGCIEWRHGDVVQLPNYLASGTNPLAGIRLMRRQRERR
jgi:glycogen debranching enzyme